MQGLCSQAWQIHILHWSEAPAVAPHAIFRALGLAGGIAVFGPGVEGAEWPGELLSLRVVYCPLHAQSPGSLEVKISLFTI